MQRDDKSRFCGDCKKTVHDLASMSKAEASVLLATTATEELCVRYLHDEMGHLVFVDTFRNRPIPLVALLRKRASQAVAVAALGMSLTACMGAMRRPNVVPPTKPLPVEPGPAPIAANTTAPTPTEPASATSPTSGAAAKTPVSDRSCTRRLATTTASTADPTSVQSSCITGGTKRKCSEYRASSRFTYTVFHGLTRSGRRWSEPSECLGASTPNPGRTSNSRYECRSYSERCNYSLRRGRWPQLAVRNSGSLPYPHPR